jgi:hypothetical protein
MTSWILRSLGAGAALALVLFALLAERTRERGMLWMSESDTAFDAGRMPLALQQARAAATAYVPGADHVRRGYERLRAVARGAERARDLELSAAAWRAMRAAAIESRHLWQPHADELREADRELRRLVPATELGPRGQHGAGLSPTLLGGLLLGAACAGAGLMGVFGREPREAGDARTLRRGLSVWIGLLGLALWCLALLRV